ncbi:hypothetical protein IW150_002215, partial [Coemansia sp. RSA 2607]
MESTDRDAAVENAGRVVTTIVATNRHIQNDWLQAMGEIAHLAPHDMRILVPTNENRNVTLIAGFTAHWNETKKDHERPNRNGRGQSGSHRNY